MYQIYGTMLCKDCVACVDALKASGVAFAFHDIGNDLDNLKVFLRLRDQSPLFDEVKSRGAIGVPCMRKRLWSLTVSF